MTSFLNKKTQYVQITPIPSFIPRQLAIDFLHSHGEILELNPLVTGYVAIKAPRDSPADEFYSTWYEISQRIQYIPGAGKLGSGAIKFRGVFHDLPFGLQTHTYAPANVDLRNKWQICGNQPGEPPEPKELGTNAPPEGLYIREDVEIKCNVAMVSFVKKEMKAAAKIMLERLIKKAELLDKGQLQAMMEGGKLKTVNPADRSKPSPGASPALTNTSPNLPNRQYSVSRPNGQGIVGSPYQEPASPYQHNLSPNPQFVQPNQPNLSPNQQYAQPNQQYAPQGQQYPPQGQPQYAQGQNFIPPQNLIGQNNVVMELPGDFSYSQPQVSPQPNRDSQASSQYSQNDGRWSAVSALTNNDSRPTSYAPSEGLRSPPADQKHFAAELPTMEETREEHDERKNRESQLPPPPPPNDEKKNLYGGNDSRGNDDKPLPSIDQKKNPYGGGDAYGNDQKSNPYGGGDAYGNDQKSNPYGGGDAYGNDQKNNNPYGGKDYGSDKKKKNPFSGNDYGGDDYDEYVEVPQPLSTRPR